MSKALATGIGVTLGILFLLMYFRMEGLVVPVFLICLICCAIYFNLPGNGGGRWRKGRGPGSTPVGPGPLPSSWEPPDYIPEWVIEEVKPKLTRSGS